MGGGLVSAELRSSRGSDEPEKPGDADEPSLSCSCGGSGGGDVLSTFMVTKTLAASRSWTCWCLEMRSLEVTAHAGSCSHLVTSAHGQRVGRPRNIQVLSQAAAVLVAFSTRLTSQLGARAFS